jgi:hypothetical protein
MHLTPLLYRVQQEQAMRREMRALPLHLLLLLPLRHNQNEQQHQR